MDQTFTRVLTPCDTPPNFLKNPNVGPKTKQWKKKEKESWATFSNSHHFGGKRACWSSGMGLGWTHKWEFKMKSTGITKKEGGLWCTPKFLDGFNYESKRENNIRKRSWGSLLSSQHFGSRGACWSSRMGLRRMKIGSIIHTDMHKPNNKLVNCRVGALFVHGWAMGKHKLIRFIMARIWGEATTFPLIVFFVSSHRASTKMSFCLEIPKWKSRNS
jgi:hypothetical protein